MAVKFYRKSPEEEIKVYPVAYGGGIVLTSEGETIYVQDKDISTLVDAIQKAAVESAKNEGDKVSGR